MKEAEYFRLPGLVTLLQEEYPLLLFRLFDAPGAFVVSFFRSLFHQLILGVQNHLEYE